MSSIDSFLEKKAAVESGMTKKAAGRAPAIDPLAAVSMGEALAKMGPKEMAKFVGKGTLGTALLSAPVIGLSGAWEGGSRAMQAGINAVSRAMGFRRMVKANPELQEMDRAKVQRTYNTLHRFNPEMASDPMVSGSFVRSTAEYDNIPTRTVSDLVSARSKMQRPGVSDRAGMFQPAASAMMGSGMQLATARESSRLQSLGRADADADTLHQRLEEASMLAGAQDRGRLKAKSDNINTVIDIARREAKAQQEGRTEADVEAIADKGYGVAQQFRAMLGERGKIMAGADPDIMAEKMRQAGGVARASERAKIMEQPDPASQAYQVSYAQTAAKQDFKDQEQGEPAFGIPPIPQGLRNHPWKGRKP